MSLQELSKSYNDTHLVALSDPDSNNSRKLLQYKQDTACPPLVALSDPDSNNSRKLLQYKQDSICPVNNTLNNTSTSSLYVDDYGDFFKKGIEKNQKYLTDAEATSIVEEYNSGLSTYALAAKYGCHRNTISRCLKKHGVEVKAEKIDTEADVAKMISMYNEGFSAIEIAERFSIAKTTVIHRLHANDVEMRTRWDYEKQT